MKWTTASELVGVKEVESVWWEDKKNPAYTQSLGSMQLGCIPPLSESPSGTSMYAVAYRACALATLMQRRHLGGGVS